MAKTFPRLIAIVALAAHILPSASLANCSSPVSLLEKDAPAPCRGYLFTPEKEKQVRLMNEDYKLLQEELEIKNKQLDLYKLQVTNLAQAADLSEKKSALWQTKAQEAVERTVNLEQSRQTRDFLFILGGVALTVLAGWAVGQAGK